MNPTPHAVLDIGQSGIRGTVQYRNGTSTSIDVVGGVTRLVDDAAVINYVAAVQRALTGVGPIECLTIGTTGFPHDQDLARTLTRSVRDAASASVVVLVADEVTSLVGSIADADGTALTWGTGLVAFGATSQRWVRVDGRGYALGDEGSGFWIGRAGLVAALNWLERRQGSKQLATAALTTLGNRDEIISAAYQAGATTRYVANFAPAVLDAADNACPVANDIVDEAVQHAAGAISAVEDQLELCSAAVAVTGGLTRSPLLINRLARKLDVEITVVPDAHLAGAIRIADNPALLARFPRLAHNSESTCST